MARLKSHQQMCNSRRVKCSAYDILFVTRLHLQGEVKLPLGLGLASLVAPAVSLGLTRDVMTVSCVIVEAAVLLGQLPNDVLQLEDLQERKCH